MKAPRRQWGSWPFCSGRISSSASGTRSRRSSSTPCPSPSSPSSSSPSPSSPSTTRATATTPSSPSHPPTPPASSPPSSAPHPRTARMSDPATGQATHLKQEEAKELVDQEPGGAAVVAPLRRRGREREPALSRAVGRGGGPGGGLRLRQALQRPPRRGLLRAAPPCRPTLQRHPLLHHTGRRRGGHACIFWHQ